MKIGKLTSELEDEEIISYFCNQLKQPPALEEKIIRYEGKDSQLFYYQGITPQDIDEMRFNNGKFDISLRLENDTSLHTKQTLVDLLFNRFPPFFEFCDKIIFAQDNKSFTLSRNMNVMYRINESNKEIPEIENSTPIQSILLEKPIQIEYKESASFREMVLTFINLLERNDGSSKTKIEYPTKSISFSDNPKDVTDLMEKKDVDYCLYIPMGLVEVSFYHVLTFKIKNDRFTFKFNASLNMLTALKYLLDFVPNNSNAIESLYKGNTLSSKSWEELSKNLFCCVEMCKVNVGISSCNLLDEADVEPQSIWKLIVSNGKKQDLHVGALQKYSVVDALTSSEGS